MKEQAAVTKDSLHEFNLQVRFQGHVEKTPPDHLKEVLAILTAQASLRVTFGFRVFRPFGVRCVARCSLQRVWGSGRLAPARVWGLYRHRRKMAESGPSLAEGGGRLLCVKLRPQLSQNVGISQKLHLLWRFQSRPILAGIGGIGAECWRLGPK